MTRQPSAVARRRPSAARWARRAGLTPAVAAGALAGCLAPPTLDAPSLDTFDDKLLPCPPEGSCRAGPTALEIGQGETAFEEVAAGGDLFLVHGAQAGPAWHAAIALRASSVPELVRITVSMLDPDSGMQLVHERVPHVVNRRLVGERPGAPWGCAGTAAGLDVELDVRGHDDDDGVVVWQELCGHDVVVVATLHDELGELLAAAAHPVRLQPDPSDGAPCPR